MKQPVLIITYYWPPAGGPGVQRWLKFATYLPQYDYDVTVVVPEQPDYPVIDQSLLDQVPNHINVIRVPISEPSRWASTLSRKRTKNLQRGIISNQPNPLQKTLLWIRGNLFIPDARVGWKRRVLQAIHHYLINHPNPTIITTGPPHSIHLIGLELQRKYTGYKWIADFRDPWTTIGYHQQLQLTKLAAKQHHKLEQQVLDTADLLIVTSPKTGIEFANKTKTKIQLITNGFDIDIAQNQGQPDGMFTLAHIGTLLSDRNPIVLWQSLSYLCKHYNRFKQDFKLQLAGNVSDEIVASINQHGLQDQVELLGYIPHDHAVRLMYTSQCLLLIEIDRTDTSAIIPGKIFEYFASRRPIIALGPKASDIEQLINDTRTGSYFNYTDPTQLSQHILDKYQLYLSGNNVANDVDDIIRFKRSELTNILDQTITYAWE